MQRHFTHVKKAVKYFQVQLMYFLLSDITHFLHLVQSLYPKQDLIRRVVGLKIYYGGQFYTITQVFNNQSFKLMTIVAANPAGTFSYYTKQDKVIVPIFESSDNLKTIKPTKTNPRILYYGGLKPCLPYFIQYTPTLSGITYAYPETSYYVSASTYPYTGHLDDHKHSKQLT